MPSPINTALPVIAGSAVQGQVLDASSGLWTEGSDVPNTYTYQWQDCDDSGGGCMNVSGATGSSYGLSVGDVGHTVRVVVTASNAGGSASQASAPTGLVGGEEEEAFVCSLTLKPSESESSLAAAIEEAKGGATICLETGVYTIAEMFGGAGEHLGRGSYVTIRAANGASPQVQGSAALDGVVRVRNTSYERWEHIKFLSGFEVEDSGTYEGSQYFELLHDTWETVPFGVFLRGGAGPVRHIVLEHDYMFNVGVEAKVEGSKEVCEGGKGTGQDVTNAFAEDEIVRHNTFNQAASHYIQYGENTTVENNLFMGTSERECSHLNVWQLIGGENDVFRNNVVIGRGTGTGIGPTKAGIEYAAKDTLEWEDGVGGRHCKPGEAISLKNLVAENNLFVDGGFNSEIGVVDGLIVSHNTIVNLQSTGPFYAGSTIPECVAGKQYTTTHNLTTEANIVFGASTESTVDYNVSSNRSAEESTHYVINWAPAWQSPASCPRLGVGCWNPFKEVEEGNHFPKPPSGYYVPSGLPLEAGYSEAGYQGEVGP